MMNEGRTINILWTGGLDSTFRIVELSQCNCTIQPYYMLIETRKSFHHELKSINKISRILRNDKRTRAKLLNPIIINEKDIPRDVSIFDSWLRLMNGNSWQYYIIAKYAHLHHLDMEMGLQFSPNGSVTSVIDETLLIPYLDSNYNVMMIDKNRANQDILNVFGNFFFPKSLYHKTKREEIDILQRDGYATIVKNVWFCFNPMWGYPCGHCFPCFSYEKEGVSLPRIGKMLYAIRNLNKKEKVKKILRLNYSYTIHRVSDVFVAKAKDSETGEVKKVFRLNETGVIILEALQDGAGVDEIARRLTDGFDVDYETAKSHVSEFVSKLNL